MDKLAYMAEWEIKEALEELATLRTLLREMSMALKWLLPFTEIGNPLHSQKIKELLSRPEVKAVMEDK